MFTNPIFDSYTIIPLENVLSSHDVEKKDVIGVVSQSEVCNNCILFYYQATYTLYYP